MRTRNSFILVILVLLSVGAYPQSAKSEEDFLDQQKLTSHMILNMFLLNVDAGKIVIMGKTIRRSQLGATQVAYVHNLEDDRLEIALYLHLKEPILVPHFEDYYVDAINVDIDSKGEIVQITSHLVPYQE